MPDYRIPPREATEDRRLGWLREALQTGESYLQSQRAYGDIDRAIEIIGSTEAEQIPKYLSRVRVNRIKRQIREIVSVLSDLRPLWGYRTDNKPYESHVFVLNKLLLSWWHASFADRQIKEALQWAAVGGTGYVSPIYVPDFWNAGRGDVRLFVYGPRDVIPFQIPRDHDLQRAYAVILRTEVPLAMAHGMYPEYADLIKAQRESASWVSRQWGRVKNSFSGALGVTARGGGENANIPVPTVDILDTYIMDSSVNNTDKPIPMGEPDTSWFYVVPPLGSDISTGFKDNQGRPLVRKATRQDSMLYPLRRKMTVVNDVLVYDDTSPWWHGRVPCIPFKLDAWPWEMLGYSLTRDNDTIQQSIINTLRAVAQKVMLGLNPPTQYDPNVTPKNVMQRIDLRKPGEQVPANYSLGGEPIKPVLPAEYHRVPAEAFEYIIKMEQTMDHQMGVADIMSLAKARLQVPSGDTLEKMEQLAGPLVSDMSRSMEPSMRELGEQMKSMFFQCYTVGRKLQVLGGSGLVEEDYDYEPGSMIPSHLPGEDMTAPSRLTQIARARWHQNNFVFHITPNTVHQITQMRNKMLYVMLYRMGYPIDPVTLAEVLDIPNFGSLDGKDQTVLGRWLQWKEIVGAVAWMQGGGPAAAETLGEKRNPGRPPSGQTGPKLAVKDQGTRTTISESS
jgi:hypothetical protein